MKAASSNLQDIKEQRNQLESFIKSSITIVENESKQAEKRRH